MRPTLESGAVIAHYRIIAPLGAGGMGEVYKAQDQTLERSIALKILPPDLVRNDERVRRFIQEARAASSLSHPHIVTVYEIGEGRVSASDGSAGDVPLHYIAMELIDGVTLRRKIHDGPTDLRSLLTYLAQAAEGVAKAHAAGIVHRDLKPDNIMVTRDGFAKVLDFGLAKLTGKIPAAEAGTQSQATAVLAETREGALLGTVAYMSPEQVSGKSADHRSDIFAFGAILYEAATRQRPFQADSDLDVMHKILHDKPAPIDGIAPNVPAELRRTIRRCLAKDPDRRFQSMKDLALELAEIVDEYEELSLASATRNSSSVSGPVLPQRPSRTAWIAGTVALLVVAAALAFGVVQWRAARSRGSAQTAFASMKIQQLTSSGRVLEAAISPDGKYVAHVTSNEKGERSLSVRHIATGSEVPVLSAVPGLSNIAFSPDGNHLYYTRFLGEETGYLWLHQVPVLGGAPRKLLFDIDTAPAFSPDGKQFAFGRGIPPKGENHLLIANADGTGERTLATLGARFGNPQRPVWSPDGKKIVCPMIDITHGWNSVLTAFDVATGKPQAISNTRWYGINDPVFLADGTAIVMTAVDTDAGREQVWIQPYPSGTAVRVTNDVNNYASISSTADDSAIAAVQSQTDTRLVLGAAADGTGGVEVENVADQRVWGARRSAAGPVVYQYTSGADSHIGLIEAPGAAPRQLTTDGVSYDPAISSDGKLVVFASERGGTMPHIYATDIDGASVRQLTNGSGETRPAVTPDGQTILYRDASGRDLWTVPAKGGPPRKLAAAAYGECSVSPDGSRVAIRAYDTSSGRIVRKLRIIPMSGGAPLAEFPVPAGWGEVRWMPDGTKLTHTREVDGVAQIFSVPLTGAAGTQLTKFDKGFISSYEWRPDGKLDLVLGTTRSDAVLIRNYR